MFIISFLSINKLSFFGKYEVNFVVSFQIFRLSALLVSLGDFIYHC